MKCALLLEYDGTQFSGWQRQPTAVSVQSELEDQLLIILRSLLRKQDVNAVLPRICITGSGRTDAGTHARGQVASFTWPEQLSFDGPKLLASLNGICTPALTIQAAWLLADSFDARRSPHQKLYSYYLDMHPFSGPLNRQRSWHRPRLVAIPTMIEAAKLFSGQHDFRSFRASDCSAKSSIRRIHSSELVRVDRTQLVYRIVGSGFLKQMVRRIVGALVAVGEGRIDLADIEGALRSPVDQNPPRWRTAPASGLYLEWVHYQDFTEVNGRSDIAGGSVQQ